MNPIQILIQSEINCLIEKSNGYQAINQNPTKGSLSGLTPYSLDRFLEKV